MKQKLKGMALPRCVAEPGRGTVASRLRCTDSPPTPPPPPPPSCHFRYKYVVQTVIAEQRGEGMHMGCRNLWDPKTDGYAQATFQNDTLICITAAFATYLY